MPVAANGTPPRANACNEPPLFSPRNRDKDMDISDDEEDMKSMMKKMMKMMVTKDDLNALKADLKTELKEDVRAEVSVALEPVQAAVSDLQKRISVCEGKQQSES